MTLSLKEFTRLKGLMARTTSDSDPEALASIRAANRVLAAHDLTWEKVFSRTVTVISELTGRPIEVTNADDDLETAFELALDSASGSFRDMLVSIYEVYQRTGTMTQAQRRVVEDAAERAAERRPAGRAR